MTRVVLDTNILVSWLVFPGGKPDEVVPLARNGVIEAFTSPRIMEELARVLRDKFSYGDIVVEVIIRKVASFCAIAETERDVIGEDERIAVDTHVLECAVAARADYIVTGDRKHLLPLGKIRNCKIVSPADFLVEAGR